MSGTSIRIHELTQELDPDEAGLMKQQSRLEEARRLREARETSDGKKPAGKRR